MGEILKLKVSPKGQITLPKKVRDHFFIRNHVYIEIKDNKIELKPVSFEDELEELIIIDLRQKGYSAEQINKMLPEKKKQLSKALAEELSERSSEETISHADVVKDLELD